METEDKREMDIPDACWNCGKKITELTSDNECPECFALQEGEPDDIK